jgi:glycosyltransferase involved in cell wall biosynthesis
VHGQSKPILPISLIVTVLNESNSIGTFLDSLENQTTYPAEFVITDGGSTDSTLDILHQWQLRGVINTRIIPLPGSGISAGRNAAIAASTYDLVAITDAGTTLDPTWLEEIIGPLMVGADVASGFYRASGTGTMDRVIASIIVPTLDEIHPEKFLPSSRSLAIRKSAWADVGGYPEWLDYCEDLVFDLELKRHGKNFAFVPDAQVTWSARPSLRSFAKQYYRYSRGDGKANLWPKRHAIRYGAYSVGTILWILGRDRVWPRLLLPALATIYLRKFWGRIWSGRDDLGPALTVIALTLTPIVVVVGDVSKMVGYPVGRVYQTRHRPHAS